MFTVIETLLFQKQLPLYWSEDERGEFAAYVASSRIRVIYFTRTAEEEVVLLIIYAKAKTDNITGAKLKEIRRVLER